MTVKRWINKTFYKTPAQGSLHEVVVDFLRFRLTRANKSPAVSSKRERAAYDLAIDHIAKDHERRPATNVVPISPKRRRSKRLPRQRPPDPSAEDPPA
jgi:hypothetical protein